MISAPCVLGVRWGAGAQSPPLSHNNNTNPFPCISFSQAINFLLNGVKWVHDSHHNFMVLLCIHPPSLIYPEGGVNLNRRSPCAPPCPSPRLLSVPFLFVQVDWVTFAQKEPIWRKRHDLGILVTNQWRLSNTVHILAWCSCLCFCWR